MKKLILLFGAILLTSISALAAVDYPPTSSPFSTPVQKYKHKPYKPQTEGSYTIRHIGYKPLKGLGEAIETGDHNEVQRLLDSGVSPNQLQETMTPLGIAVQGDNIEAFKILMNHKNIDVNKFYTVIQRGSHVSTTKLTAITDAIYTGNPEMMRMLLDKGANVDYIFETINLSTKPATMELQETPLTLGFQQIGQYVYQSDEPTSKYDVIEQFVQLQRIADKTKNINRKFIQHSHHAGAGNIPHRTDVPYTSNPNSLLMKIADVNYYKEEGNPFRDEINKVIFSLIDRGADANYGYYLDIANTVKIMQYGYRLTGGNHLQSSIEVIKNTGKYMRYSVLNSAIIGYNAPLVEYLLAKGASTSVAGDNGGVVFTSIISPEVLNVFLDNGFDINTLRYDGFGLILSAANKLDLLKEMLKHGADPNITLKGVGNALTFTAGIMSRKQKKETINLLKMHGAVEYTPEKVNPVKTSTPTTEDIKAMKYALLNPNSTNVAALGVTAVPNYRKHTRCLAKMNEQVTPLYKQLTARPSAALWNKIIVAMDKVINDVNDGK